MVRLKPVGEQVVVVMGASSGIGREAAQRFARRGAKVAVSARNRQALETLVEEIRGEGGEALAIPADVTEWEQVKAVADGTADRYGRLDTWAHAAGVGLWAAFEHTEPAAWARVIDVNLNGQAFGAKAALPHLRREGRGALIHVSSIEARMALPYQSAYAAAKHGVHGLVKSLRMELQAEGIPISVTEIMPAGTNTPLFDAARTRIGVKPQPPPPIYEPSVAAEALVYAAEHPVREMVLSGVSRVGMAVQSVSPRLMDRVLLWMGTHLQQTDERKWSDAPDNLFHPLGGAGQVEGSLGVKARPFSTYTWLEMHPGVRRALFAASIGAALVAARALGRRREMGNEEMGK